MAAALAEEVEASLAKGNNSFSVGEGLYLFLLSYVRLCLTVRGSDVCLLSHSQQKRKKAQRRSVYCGWMTYE